MTAQAIETVAVHAYTPRDDPWMEAAVPGAKPVYRADGWTPFRQHLFLRAIAEGKTVEMACAGVGLSVQSAYAFRNRASGAAFAIGWAAARLLARERIADTLLTRALEGQVETITRADGATIDRLKYDNRLALGLLTRLDRQAESQGPGAQAARLVAQEFEAFTEALARDDSPARAGLFLGTRAVAEPEAELAPLVALARADRFARTGAGLATEVDTADLDLAERASWTAEQWQRAEAAGLMRVAPLSPAGGAGGGPDEEFDDDDDLASLQFPQFPPRGEDIAPVWEDAELGLVTDFPPPDGFAGEQRGFWGQSYYVRTLTPEEEAAWHAMPLAPEDEEFDAAMAKDAATRDAFFFGTGADPLDAPPLEGS